MSKNFFGERKGNVVLRKAGSERPTEKTNPEEGLIAGEILKKLRLEAMQSKAEEQDKIKAEQKRLDEIFSKKKDLH